MSVLTVRTRVVTRVSAVLAGVPVLIGLLATYELYSRHADSVFFPGLAHLTQTFWRTWTSQNELREVLVPSLERMVVGFLLASLAGIVLGVLVGRIRWLEEMLDPFLQFLRSIPAPAVIPIAVLIIGINDRMQIVIIVFGSIWPILLNSIQGARTVPEERLDTAAVFGLGRWAVLRRVVLPSALPAIFAGLRVGLGIALIMMVVSELTASTNGIGYFILNAQRGVAIDDVYAGVGLIGLVGFALNKIFLAVERRVVGWRYAEGSVQ